LVIPPAAARVAHYLGRHGESRVAKAALISAVPPLMVKTEKILVAFPKKCSMDCRRRSRPIARNSIATCRRGHSMASTDRAWKASEAIIQNWWRQGMMGGAKAHYDGIVAFSQTDFTERPEEDHRACPGDAWR